MAHPPALETRVLYQGAWRAGVALLLALCSATCLLWWAAHSPPRPGWVGVAALGGCALAIGCVAGWIGARHAQTLRWDGQQWWLAGGAAPADAGSLRVAIDLGNWMLLRFVAQGRSVWRSSRWVPVQRRGLEGAWHALRCAVHASPSDRESGSA
jgi:hypothetical protein